MRNLTTHLTQRILPMFVAGMIFLAFTAYPGMATVEPDNPNCCDLNPDNTPDNNIGFKVNLAGTDLNGTWQFVNNGDITTITCNSDIFPGSTDYEITFVVSPDGTTLDWTSNVPLDAVIMKGGNNGSNIYYYDPEATSGTGLTCPLNTVGNLPEISHVEVCFDIELEVSKSAETGYIRTWEWDIAKSVTPDAWHLFSNDQGTSQYTVTVTKTGFVDSGWGVSGEITITNPSPFDAVLTEVTDLVSGGIAATVVCPVTLPYTLVAGATLVCTYSAPLPDGTTRLNTATAVTAPGSDVGGGSGTADVVFGDPTTVVNDQVTISDSWVGQLGVVSDSYVFNYDWIFDCDDEGSNVNTATIVETGQSDDANVDVTCYDLDIYKTASTSFTRTYEWDLVKVAAAELITLMPGQVYDMEYQIDVSATYTDSDFAVAGEITVENNTPIDAVINGVDDIITPGDIVVVPDCGLTFPYTLAAGASFTCSYTSSLPDATDRTNTASAELQNYAYHYSNPPAMFGTTTFSTSTAVDFASATITPFEECINLDDYWNIDPDVVFEDFGDICYNGTPGLQATITYIRTFGPYEAPDDCGSFTIPNCCTFTNCDDPDGSAYFDVDVNIPCGSGCTLTLGYWKTHSILGPAPYDDNWGNLGDADGDGTPEEEGEEFYLSGQTYYEVLWTAPAGNVYYILARQFIAAELNMLNGASSPVEVSDAFAEADALLSSTTPAEAASLKGQSKKAWTNLATVLDDYNNGVIGPGHCDDSGLPDYQSEIFVDYNSDVEAEEVVLNQNYPNPFSSTTVFSVEMPATDRAELNIYSLTGQKVATVYSGILSEGAHKFEFTLPGGMPPGIYIYSLETTSERFFRKMTVR